MFYLYNYFKEQSLVSNPLVMKKLAESLSMFKEAMNLAEPAQSNGTSEILPKTEILPEVTQNKF